MSAFRVEHLENLQDPRLDPFRELRENRVRRLGPVKAPSSPKTSSRADPPEPRLFIAEGEFVVRQLLLARRDRFRVRAMLVSPERFDRVHADFESLAQTSPSQPAPSHDANPRFDLFVAPSSLIEQVCGFDFHRGIIACGEELPGPTASQVANDSAVLLVLEDLTNHDNVGGLFRVARALGGSRAGVLLSPRCCDPLYRKSIRVSMGQVFHVPFASFSTWESLAPQLHGAGFRLFAMTPDAAATDLAQRGGLGSKPAIMLGSEGPGLTPEAISSADERIRIAIDPAADSLNVVTAGAIALHRFVVP
ncbi:MAG: RNA methyltransferase [Planctomycetota bacterium]|nr:RNA methyltransferase [Planctomycetota bacterium]